MPDNAIKISRCPQCNKSCRMDRANPYRPFCCERCKMLDLGDWLNEEHVISEAAGPWSDSEDELKD